ncbi:cytochrome c oxidase subunit II [Halocatena halophila]|uniref:cytochrome c oxidase subunit II n=1 Tax=Halocatena halophila TaxID=2814576 RepID=UPI002ED1CE96
MTGTRIRSVLSVITGLLVATVLAGTAAAQPSVNIEQINNLNEILLYAAIPITVLVEVILIYTVYRFRNSGEAKPTQENRRLEISWTVATAIVLLFVGLSSTVALGSAYLGGTTATTNSPGEVEGLSYDYNGTYAPAADEDAVQVEVVARQFSWTFNYLGADGNLTSTNKLVIPANKPVYLHLTAADTLHSFHAPKLGLKQDAFPGEYHTLKTKSYEPGTYQLYCAEFCGSGHSQMLGTIEVKSQQEYQNWLEQQQSEGGAGNETADDAGNETAGDAGNETANETQSALAA